MNAWKIGIPRQVISASIIAGLCIIATFSPPIGNIHLVITILVAVLHSYIAYLWKESKVIKLSTPSYAYISAFVFNAAVSFAYSWWFSGCLWTFVSLIYLGVHVDEKVKKEIEGDKQT